MHRFGSQFSPIGLAAQAARRQPKKADAGLDKTHGCFDLGRHSGAMRSIEPGIARFHDVQLHI
jgi:hypothetical protein